MTHIFTPIRPLLWALLALVLSTTSCRKETEKTGDVPNGGNLPVVPTTFEGRVEGKWVVKLVQYSASVPLQQGLPPLTIAGADPNATGTFDVGVSPNTIAYNLRVNAVIDLGFGFPIPLPITQTGNGTWVVSSNKKKVTVTQTDGQIQEFNVLVDEPFVQVWQGAIPLQIPIPGAGGGLSADAVVTLVKAQPGS
jgi:hypothetical protein